MPQIKFSITFEVTLEQNDIRVDNTLGIHHELSAMAESIVIDAMSDKERNTKPIRWIDTKGQWYDIPVKDFQMPKISIMA